MLSFQLLLFPMLIDVCEFPVDALRYLSSCGTQAGGYFCRGYRTLPSNCPILSFFCVCVCVRLTQVFVSVTQINVGYCHYPK
jgi:hypothetical protein